MKKIWGLFNSLLGIIVGFTLGFTLALKIMKKPVNDNERKYRKFKLYYEMLNQWLLLKKEGKSFSYYFIEHGFKTIAIYGMGEMGNRLLEELLDLDGVKVKYGIDEKTGHAYSNEIKIVSFEDEWEMVDVIIVSALFDFNSIQERIKHKIDCPIVSLEDVIFQNHAIENV